MSAALRIPARALALLGACLLAGAAVGSAWAQQPDLPDVRVDFASDREVLTVGDVATLTLEVVHPDDLSVTIARAPRSWGAFEVVDQTAATSEPDAAGGIATTARLRVRLFATGTFQTPDLPITVRGADGATEEVYPFPVEFRVTPTLADPNMPLNDLRNQADLSMPLWEEPVARAAALVLGAAALLGALAAGAVYLYRRFRKDGGAAALAFDTRPPWELAIEEIDRIERLGLPEEGSHKRHYTLVTDAMRIYAQGMWLKDVSPLESMDMTTDEILSALRRGPLGVEGVRQVADLLEAADLVKFAKVTPRLAEAYESTGQARHIVEVTRPREPEVAADGGAGRLREATA